MFGIGLPELILIMALALIVIGPDKLPDMAKSVAKQLLELKKTAASLKESLQEEMKDEELSTDKLYEAEPPQIAKKDDNNSSEADDGAEKKS